MALAFSSNPDLVAATPRTRMPPLALAKAGDVLRQLDTRLTSFYEMTRSEEYESEEIDLTWASYEEEASMEGEGEGHGESD